ncbi:MAG: secondary thiamine-phosphate synthase enzyme YjbQ [Pseudomonadota bacterium]
MAVTLTVRTSNRTEFIDITEQVRQAVTESNVRDGVCFVFVPHTTAGVTINEGADPDVQRDILGVLNEVVPARFPYRHSEGNSPAHIKASLVGSSVQVIVEGGKPLLGTWQSVFFCEFDGPRNRKVYLSIKG